MNSIVNMKEFVHGVASQTLAEEDGVWRTINGSPVFIKNGQSVEDAIKEKFGGGGSSAAANRAKRGHLELPVHDGGILERDRVQAIRKDIGVGESEAKRFDTAIRNYTSSDYDLIRSTQQGAGRGDPRYDYFRDAGDALEHYISNAPAFDGKVYRGMASAQLRANLEQVQIGDVVDMKGTSSWTSRSDFAAEMALPPNGNRNFNNGVVFESDKVVKSTSIRHLSAYPNEDEVLVSKEAKFVIKEKVVEPTGLMRIKVEEAKDE